MFIAEVSNRYAQASIALQGAHLFHWQPEGEQPVIWLSEDARFAAGQSIRGGIPVCWPWFGAHATEKTYPAHGFVRRLPWTVTETQVLADERILLVLQFVHTNETRRWWPYPCELSLRMTIGTTLELELITKNTGNTSMTIGEALHSYFVVSDIQKMFIQGLEGHTYIDALDDSQRKQQSGSITIDQEVDRIYLDAPADCVINDPGLQRRIRISKQGSHSTVVWNPWIDKSARMGDMGANGYLSMVCVESTNAVDDVITIEAGAEHCLSVCYELEP